MKKAIYKSLGFLAAGIMAASCIQETFPEGGTQLGSQVGESPMALEGMLNGIPASMNSTNTAAFASRYNDHTDFGIAAIHAKTDFMVGDLATLSETPFYNRYYFYCMGKGFDSRSWPGSYFWETYYTWIKMANDIISLINPETASKDQLVYLGRALTYRASFYLDLARLYEPKPVRDPYAISQGYKIDDSILGLTVPIVTPELSEKEANNNPRARKEDMYAFILADLDNAEKYLTGVSFDYREPSLVAVWGLKARTYLEMGYWEDGNASKNLENAATYARKAIDESGRKPLTKDQWQDPVNGFNNGASNASWMWGQTTSSQNVNNLLCFTGSMCSEAVYGYGPRAQIGIDKRLYNSINDSDWRKRSWLDPEFVNNPESEEFKGVYKFAGSEADQKNFINGNPAQEITAAKAYQHIKFRPAKGNCTESTIGNETDHCLMRIEEMYFIEAEAVAHTDLNRAKQLLETFVNTYRDAEYKTLGSDLNGFLVNDLLLQKRIEFWCEGVILYDHKRLDVGFTRGYDGTNHPMDFAYNCEGRSPLWNSVVTRLEFQSNKAINDSNNNPDPSDKIKQWVK